MMVHCVLGGTVAAHDDTVEPDPLPQLAEIAGAVFLVVEHGNHVVVALGVRNVVDARILDQIIIHAGLDDRVIVIRFDASCQRRGINADTAQGFDQVFAPDAFVFATGSETDKHADDTGQRE